MSSFPLYDTLIGSIQDKEKPVDKNKLIKWIHTLDQDGKNKVYALIRYFSYSEKVDQTIGVPFEGNFYEGDLTFDLDKFPETLQHILFEFTRLHIQHMKDSQKIEKMRKKSSSNK